MANLLERHQRDIRGVLSCLDRVVVQGTIPSICHPKAMATMLDSRGIRLFDYTQFVQPFRDAIRAHAEKIAAEQGVTVEYIAKMKTFRKEDRIQQILSERGDHPGLVHIFSAMEPCSSYEPWHDKTTGNTFLRRDTGKCLHYYFYFIDEVLGLCFLAIPTWCPFRALFYFNGHNWLASKLRQAKVAFELNDNAFADIADWQKAQDLSDGLMITELHARTPPLSAIALCSSNSAATTGASCRLSTQRTSSFGALRRSLRSTTICSGPRSSRSTSPMWRPSWAARQRDQQSARPAATSRSGITACASKGGVCATTSDPRRSRCTTSTASFFESRRRRTTLLSSDTTAWWNSSMGNGS